jgi:hypothetical protein
VLLPQDWACTEILVPYQNSQVSWLIQSRCQTIQPTKTKVQEMVTVFAINLGMYELQQRIVVHDMHGLSLYESFAVSLLTAFSFLKYVYRDCLACLSVCYQLRHL